ncbi:MAG TPA: 2OG-Fe(II) oxygenase [Pyrinomonadaceae bacterium]|nr:2OG-Fe(II) oxygenase [Pyrinomonadaceae bacterium]
MTKPSAFDLLVERHFLSESTCHNIINEATDGAFTPAPVYGSTASGAIDERIRKASRLTVSQQTIDSVNQQLLDYKPTIEQHFQVSLRDCEEPQFLRYSVGDFFVAHQDGNTGMIRLASDAERRISIVIFLNGQSDQPSPGTYSGGSLRFSDYRQRPPDREFSMPVESGLLVAFRSELTHEVTPITRGERYSIVSWYR